MSALARNSVGSRTSPWSLLEDLPSSNPEAFCACVEQGGWNPHHSGIIKVDMRSLVVDTAQPESEITTLQPEKRDLLIRELYSQAEVRSCTFILCPT
mmetsp:Transcript_6163/g.13158  ORF Transcript_6163/g.13158 Transcript_6163/m.13158 type:complete len:97 (+) Transcript_6163:21-311(+)